jgi:two-component system osmolarity sensor histidine kinase EnvZ
MARAKPRAPRRWPGLRPAGGIGLFWRTLSLLSLLLLLCIALWLQAFISLETAPRAVRDAQQLASLVNLSRAALQISDPIGRLLLIKTLADEEGLRLSIRQAEDRHVSMREDFFAGRIVASLRQQLGAGAVVAESVNDEPGLWIGFDIEGDNYWLRTDPARLVPARAGTWALWLLTAGALSLLGSVLIARIINQPLHALADASARLQRGQAARVHLDEKATTREIREVNVAFNRMSEQLARLEQERALLLAGISHDLRTPLARLRLEAEMSVPDARSREHMVADMGQMEGIIERFLARSATPAFKAQVVVLQGLIEQACFALSDDPQVRISQQLEPQLQVLADPVELLRVLTNLLENARLHGRSADGISRIDIRTRATQAWVLLTVTDHGPGVPPDQLHQLTRPYFRAGKARPQDPAGSGGSGLGLAIVESSMLRMGGGLSLSLAEHGGLCASLRLRRA